jgi:hypothetical protein
MGRLDQYAKDIFATETATVTRGAAAWQPPSEIGLTEVRLDGCILIRDASLLASLPDPWPHAAGHDEIAFEAKMQGEHLDLYTSERACLRRQARQVKRMEADSEHPWEGDLPLWLLASRVPAILRKRRTVQEVGEGCFRIETGSYQYLWIAANELPLREELLPFLIARSGDPLDELARWVRERRPSVWLERMLKCLPMSTAVYDDLIRFVLSEPEDDLMAQRQKQTVRVFLDMTPDVKAEVVADADRDALRLVLEQRELPLSAAEQARIDACTDVATLKRWLKQAVRAASAAEALR